jgi:hypothetical protein
MMLKKCQIKYVFEGNQIRNFFQNLVQNLN